MDKLEKNGNRIKKIINENFFTNRNGDLAEALMEFGALVCKPKFPRCADCCINKVCKYSKSSNMYINDNTISANR